MNLESLKIFRNVVEAGGFSKASARSRLSQSAISKQIRALEGDLGQRLFDRTTQTVTLTDAGKLLYERSRRILVEVDETVQSVRGMTGEKPPQLRIGTTSSVGISYFPGIFTNFSKRHPHCRLDVQVNFSGALLRGVEDRELDCAIVCLPKKIPQSIQAVSTFIDPMTLVGSKDFLKRTGKEKPRDEKEIAGLLQDSPLILISRKTYTRRIIDHYLFEHGVTNPPTIELDSFDLIVTFVSLGLGISIVPQRVFPVYARSRSMSYTKLANLKLTRTLGIIVHKDRTIQPILQEFIRYFSF